MATCFKVMAIKNLYRFDDVDLITVTEFLIRSLSYHRVHMDRIYRFAFRVFIQYTTNCPEHMVHRFAEVLAAMSCNKDKLSVTNPIEFWMRIVPFDGMLHRIDIAVFWTQY